ncbi:MAG: thioredoxin family protein [Francisellaceae bacterium]|jgi:thioredoxin 1|nr:thioredoxin family protein [Francisellaceae bacterium]MBT6538251.1 thioredoxin family protein [Francisellaceae bacterium]
MEIQNINEIQFEELISSGEEMVTVIDFWAPWCGPCVQFGEIFTKIATEEQNPKIRFAKVNVEEEKSLAEEFELRSIPHLMIFRGNIAIYSDSGAMTAQSLRELIAQASSLDINEIKNNLETE